MVTRSIPEMAAVISRLLGELKRTTSCKLGHSLGKVVIAEAIVTSGMLNSNERRTELVLGERNKGMNGINHPCISVDVRVFKFGSKCSFMVQSCMTENVSGDRESLSKKCLSSCILRAYFRKRAHSAVDGSLLKDYRIG